MDTKIQLSHPTGKKAVKIEKGKYDILSNAILHSLKNRPLTHTELNEAVSADFKKNNIIFDGSIGWYMEHVKLDLEANELIQRIKDKSQLKFQIVDT